MSSLESFDSRVWESRRDRAMQSRSWSRVRSVSSDNVSQPRGGSPSLRANYRRERCSHTDRPRYRNSDRREPAASSTQTENLTSYPPQVITGDNENNEKAAAKQHERRRGISSHVSCQTKSGSGFQLTWTKKQHRIWQNRTT